MTTLSTTERRPVSRRGFDPFERAWRLLCSVRLAILVILVISLATLVGTILPQAPADVLESPLSFASWLAKQRVKFGDAVDLYAQLGFFNIFGAGWFRTILAFLSLEIVVCTLNRLPPMWKSARHPKVKVARGFFNSGESHAALATPLPRDAAFASVESVLKRRHFHLRVERDEGGVYLFGDRFGLSPLATFVSHTGLVLILIGAVLGSLLGFREDGFAVPDGQTRAVGHGTNLVVLNEGFTEEDFPDSGRPKDYYSDVVLYDNGTEVARHRVRVNDPLTYNGINVHQSFFGNAVDLMVRDTETGNVVYSGSVPLPYTSELYGADRPMGTVSVLDGRVQLDVIGTAGMFDQNISPGQVGLIMYVARMGSKPIGTRLNQNEPTQVGPLEFTFLRERQFAGLQVVFNPGVPVIWLACTFVMVGILIVFWLPPRKLWAQVVPAESGGSLVLLRGMAADRAQFDEEFERLVADLRPGLGLPPASPGTPASDAPDGAWSAAPQAAALD